MRSYSFLACCLTFFSMLLFNSNSSHADDDKMMTIGSKAPAIDVEHWVSDNDGAFGHPTELDSGKVYVIEFWATWCGPCIASMPHLAELQKEYSDSVQIISISDESLKKVEKFLEREVRGEEEMTYAELTSGYCLTTDPDESVKNDYFRAAGRTGIPCAFIVGKDGIVEWIGHPMAMDKPLKQVVNDDWDRDEFMVKFKKEQEERAARRKAQAALRKASRELQGLIRKKDFEGAVEKIDGMIQDEDYAQMKDQLKAMKVQMMVENNLEGAAKALDKFAKANRKNVNLLNTIAWSVYEQHEKDGEIGKRLLKSACRCAEMAADEAPENGAVLDTYAHLVYAAFEDVDKAIEIQKQAVEHAGSQIDQIQPFLDELMKVKEDK